MQSSPPPNPEIESLIAAFYAAFDNRNGRKPAIEELRSMFAEGATITRVTDDGATTLTPDAFIAPRATMLTDGTLVEFHEWETATRTDIFGSIACRSSTYEKDGKLNGAECRGAGHKFITLHNLGQRWFIHSILWQDAHA